MRRRDLARLLPAVVVLAFVAFLPLGRVAWTSVHRSTVTGSNFNGVDNYVNLFTNSTWWLAVATTLVIVTFVVLVQMILGTVIGAALHRVAVLWPVTRVLVLAPLMLLSAVSVMTWRDAVSGGYLAEWFDLGEGGSVTGLVAVTVSETWRGTGLVAAVVAVALFAVPRSLSSATIADGATVLQRWRRVVLPAIAPAMAGVAMFRVFDTFRVIDGPLLAGHVDSELTTAPLLTWTTQFTAFEWGLGAAMSIIVLVVAAVLAAIIGPLFRVRRLL